jgi:hypothetical protein
MFRKTSIVEADQGDFGGPVSSAKIFSFSFHPNQSHLSRYPAPQEGRFAIVTDVGCGMRWTRMVLLTRALEADGEVVWS